MTYTYCFGSPVFVTLPSLWVRLSLSSSNEWPNNALPSAAISEPAKALLIRVSSAVTKLCPDLYLYVCNFVTLLVVLFISNTTLGIMSRYSPDGSTLQWGAWRGWWTLHHLLSPSPTCPWAILRLLFVCLSVYVSLFTTHLLRNCSMNLSEILHKDEVCPGHCVSHFDGL